MGISDAVILNFVHGYSFPTNGPDAAQVRVSINGGPFMPVSAESFSKGGYPAGVVAGAGFLQGQHAFRGNTGAANGGIAFVTSSAVLGTFAPNDKIAVQFLGAWGDCTGGGRSSAWEIKNVQLLFGRLPQTVTFQAQASAFLYGEARGVTYQWQRQEGTNFVDIPGEITSALSFFPTAEDFQTAFRLELSVLGTTIYTRPVKLTNGNVEPPTVAITSTQGKVAVSFTGSLQSAARPEGPYTEVAGAVSPYTVPDNQRAIFFRTAK